jgi:hypothetical protein
MLRRLLLTLGVALLLPASAWAQPQTAQEIARACAGDIERLCAGVPPGEGRIKACIKAHITQLSAPCFDTLLRVVASEKEPE